MSDLREDVLKELAAVAMARPADCLRWEDGKLELKEEIPKESAAAISSIERSAAGVKLRFHDKLKALELLLQHSETAEAKAKNNLLEAILNAVRQPMDTDDIPEVEEGEDDENGIFITEGG